MIPPDKKSFPVLLSLWLPVLIWAGIIFYFSNIPYLRITENWWDYPLRKLCHMVEYGVLARLLARALAGATSWSRKRIFILSWILAIAYSATDEFHQSFVAGRVGSLIDIGIDAAGAWIVLKLTFK